MGDERIVALDGVSLEFESEKVYCLLGVSGSGKSTLLNLMAGLERPTKGEIVFNGQHIEKMSEKKLALFRQRHIGFVFQSYNLLSTLTALENVTLPLIFRKVPKRKRLQRARAMLDDVGLGDRMKHKPSQMSGGQQQRVSIARAFVNDPSVVFADEPTGNLDTKTTFEMMNLIMGMAVKNKQTLIIVTHNLELSKYADQIIHIRDGIVVSVEDNVRQNPHDDYVDFLSRERALNPEKAETAEAIPALVGEGAETRQAIPPNDTRNGQTAADPLINQSDIEGVK